MVASHVQATKTEEEAWPCCVASLCLLCQWNVNILVHWDEIRDSPAIAVYKVKMCYFN